MRGHLCIIIHDRTLTELCQKRPSDTAALHDITGIGSRKAERKGAIL